MMDKKKWVIYLSCAFVIILYTFGIKHIQFQEDTNKSLREDIFKLHEINKTHGEIHEELFDWCKKLGKQNIEQQEFIDKLSSDVYGEEEIGENSE